jgi:hypothetical protein
MNRLFSFRHWVHGLLGAFINGAANGITLVVVDPMKFNLQEGWKNLAGATAVSAIVGAALYLKQSPLPPETAEEKSDRGNTPPLGLWAMLLLLPILASMPACSTSPSTQTIDTVSASTQVIASQVVPPVLDANPKYEPALVALAAGIDAVFLADAGVTPEAAQAFVATLALRYELTPKAQQYLVYALLDLYAFYRDTYKPTVSARLDPNAAKIIAGFRAGLMAGIERYKIAKEVTSHGDNR